MCIQHKSRKPGKDKTSFFQMSRNETINRLRNTNEDISAGRLKSALEQMHTLAEQKMQWEVGADIKTAITNYGYMLSYFAEGIVDPDLDKIFGRMQLEAWTLFDRLRRAIDIPGYSSLYFDIVRLRQLRGESLESLLAAYYSAINADADIVSTLASAESEDTTYRGQKPKEEALRALFECVWTSHPLNEEQLGQLLQGIDTVAAKGEELDVETYAAGIIAALMLGDLQYADTGRQVATARLYITYADSRPRIAAMALCALAIMLFRHRRRPIAPILTDILASVAETATWNRDFKAVTLEMVRTRNTENVDRAMRNEIIPGVSKIRDSIMDQIKEGNIPAEGLKIEDLEKLEANPEWEGMLENSGIADGLKRLSEMQMDGADIFMSTFAHMKTHAFFKDVINWFAPYNPENSYILNATSGTNSIAQLVGKFNFLCDSDKYSMVLSADLVPKAQRDLLLNQLAQNTELIAESTDPNEANMSERDVAVRRATRSFLQNFYRFVKLFRRKGEFSDPFRDGLNLFTVPALIPHIHDNELASLLGEYYFKYGYWEDALTIFRRTEEATAAPDAILYQKIGYCHEQMGDMSAALTAYEHAELLDDNSRWLLRRLAYTNRSLGRHGQALSYYKRLAETAPEDTEATIALAYAYIRIKRWNKALNYLRKAEFDNPEDSRLWRPLAWVLFALSDYESARKYWQKVLDDSPTAEDYLNMGHLDAATGNIREALAHYRNSQKDGDTEALIRRLETDKEILGNAGITPVKMTLIEEALRNSL